VYEELHFETEQTAQPPAPRRSQSETSVAAARMAAAPSFRAPRKQGGVPIVPIAIGLILIVGIAAFALVRGQPLSKAVASPAPLDPTVVKVGRPPESPAPPVVEPEPALPVITRDLPPDPAAPAAPDRKRQPERDLAAAPTRPIRPPPTRELARQEKAAPATARPTPPAPAPPRPEPEPPPPPPQFVAARQELPVASAPMQIGPSYAREGQRKARLTDPGCVANSLRLPRDISDVGGETATVKFAVDETGQVSQYAYLAGPSDQRVANAIWVAIRRCEFVPGATAQGKPVALWVTMPIKFGK
jgi:protein TonB